MIVVSTRELGPIPVEAAAQVLGVPDGELLVVIRKEDGPEAPPPSQADLDDLSAQPPRPAITSLVTAAQPPIESDAPRVYTPSLRPPLDVLGLRLPERGVMFYQLEHVARALHLQAVLHPGGEVTLTGMGREQMYGSVHAAAAALNARDWTVGARP